MQARRRANGSAAPVGAQDDVAGGDVSAAIALADRFDTLTGCFAVGLAPTGAADPFALRRACIGALRTLLDRGYTLAFSELVDLAYGGLEGKKLDLSRIETVAKIEEFATERLRGLIASATSSQVADAVLTGTTEPLKNVVAVLTRARVLKDAVDSKEPWIEKARIVAKRLSGISREAKAVLHTADEFAGSTKGDDVHIQTLAFELNDIATQPTTTASAMSISLSAIAMAAPELDRIFVETLVNDPNDSLTGIRLETLAHAAQSMLRIADFSKLG